MTDYDEDEFSAGEDDCYSYYDSDSYDDVASVESQEND